MPQPSPEDRRLYELYEAKLPVRVEDILLTHESGEVAVLFRFVDGEQAAILLPDHLLSRENVRISAVAAATLWHLFHAFAQQAARSHPAIKGLELDRRQVGHDTVDAADGEQVAQHTSEAAATRRRQRQHPDRH